MALGVAAVQGLFTISAGHAVGIAAVSGAVCASLTDVPNPPERVWWRLLPAALLAALVSLAVGLTRGSAVATTLLIGAIAFVGLMALAWGPRAGPLSFVGVLALVFTLAWGEAGAPRDALIHAAWVLGGALSYGLWARGSAVLLRRRYRELALRAAMHACAQRLRSRAARIAGEVTDQSIRASIADDMLLAEALQNARDQIFAARPSANSRRQVELLLGLIELRDLLLASRLDIEHLGEDASGQAWRRVLADTLVQLAATLERIAAGQAVTANAEQWRRELAQRLAAVETILETDPRRHLVHALQARLGHMLDDVAAMAERAVGPDRPQERFTPEQLRQFVSPEGWPLAALKPHLTLQSSVLRHALRATLALTTAYVLAVWLPWSSHPQWMVLSVAVVLRGNLEQTLARRNDRILGTVIGCVLVVALAQIRSPALLGALFIIAVGTAHAYVNVRYRVAATAATLMALLQPLLLEPGSTPPIAERLADTVIGAALAWIFCFVLPSWERASFGRLSQQLRAALARHAANVLRWQPSPEQQMAARLSRQQCYTVLAALATTAQRTRVEPLHVRLPEAEIEAVLTHGYRLMAVLGNVQQMLNRRVARLDPARVTPALAEAVQACAEALQPPAGSTVPEPPDSLSADWPEHAGQQDLTPWLLRRLQRCRWESQKLGRAAGRLLGTVETES